MLRGAVYNEEFKVVEALSPGLDGDIAAVIGCLAKGRLFPLEDIGGAFEAQGPPPYLPLLQGAPIQGVEALGWHFTHEGVFVGDRGAP